MLWYAIQTYTGREEQLVRMIRRQVPGKCFGECFVAYYEQLRDRRQENQIHILRLFPGYIFISSDDVEGLFQCLKGIPAMAKIMSSGAFLFTPLYEGEAEFLLKMMDSDHVVRLTYVATDGRDHVSCLSGPLEHCETRIQTYRFRDRYAKVKLRVGGQEKIVRMGIILNDDIRREMAYGKVEAQIRPPEKYRIPEMSRKKSADFSKTQRKNGKCPAEEESGEFLFAPGDSVAVIEGAFEGNVAVVSQVKKHAVRISVRLFGREISTEVPTVSVRRIA